MFNKKDNMSMIERLFWLSKLNQSGGSGGGGGSAKYETAIMSLTFTGKSFQDFYIYETLEKGVCGYIYPVSCYVSESEEVIKAPAIKVVFDGVIYNNLTMNLEDNSYGTSTSSPDWTEYPFFIMFNNEEIVIGVADSNEHSIAVYLEVMLGTVTLTNKTGDDIYTSFSAQYYAIPDDTTKTLPVLLEGGLGVIYFGNQPSSDYAVAGENAGYSSGQQGLVVYDQPASVNLFAGGK